jgi:hypothetical protein
MGEPAPDDAVLFVGVSLVLGIASRHLLRGTRVPYTVALLVLGVALGSLGNPAAPHALPFSTNAFIFLLQSTGHHSSCKQCPEYGTHHGLGKLGAGIRICKYSTSI